MTDIKKAEATVAELQRKREQAVQRATELSDERAACSYSAHVQHDHESRKRLSEINQALALHASELASIDAAIVEASKRVQQAQAAETAEARAEQAEKLIEAASLLRDVGRDLDSALFGLVTSGEVLAKMVDDVHALGLSHPNHQQVLSMGERAIGTVLMNTVWKRSYSPIPPHERKTFTEITAAWATMIENAAEQMADKSEAA
jgi:chromosome segregation ATPase